jgi:hypothetical protein
MECKRLNRMIRDWYVQVQDETLAPARMVEFMENHVESCDTCFVDPNIHEEIAKITAIVLPPSKMTKKPKKKQAPMEPTAAALAALEAGVNDVAAKEVAAIDDGVKDNAAAIEVVADDDDIVEEIEVGDDDIIVDIDVDDVVVEDADLE